MTTRRTLAAGAVLAPATALIWTWSADGGKTWTRHPTRMEVSGVHTTSSPASSASRPASTAPAAAPSP